MEPASKVLRNLYFTEDAAVLERLACAAWRTAVGPRIAGHTEALKLVRHTLVVEVEDAIWQKQLFALRLQILRKVDQRIGSGIVKDVEFRVAPRRKGMQRAEAPVEFSLRPADEADAIADPGLRRIYKMKRKQALA